jgi:5-methylcytosine-specific restriction protein A
LLSSLLFHSTVVRRRSRYASLLIIARLDSSGAFIERGVTAKAAVADVLGVPPERAHRLVSLARELFPSALTGAALVPRLAATAEALGRFVIDQAHAEVIARELSSPAARRWAPRVWADTERRLADWAHDDSPAVLASEARKRINRLDHDGPEPDDRGSGLVNELHLTPYSGGGGRIKGTLDALNYDVVARAIEAAAKPEDDEGAPLSERRATALGEISAHALDEGRLPARGGERPQVTVIMSQRDLVAQNTGTLLDHGGALSAAYSRMLLCDCTITPVVLGEHSEPLYVGRTQRCAIPAQRKALIARDGGCAHPGCDRPPHWTSIHHTIPWGSHGNTDIDNVVMLCLTHHRMMHASGWVVRMINGYPEFIPPRWVDPAHKPPRKSPPLTIRHIVELSRS